MESSNSERVTVFGGTGFAGRRAVRHLAESGFLVRIASRRPPGGGEAPSSSRVAFRATDINDEDAVHAALSGAAAAVNAVSLYVESGDTTFRSIHVEAAARIAAAARRAGCRRLVHLSGIGSDPRSTSAYVRARGDGEAAVRAAFDQATIVRSAVMIAPDDALLTAIRRVVASSPVYPLFGRGETRLQPVFVEDVGEGIARIVAAGPDAAALYEFGGPEVVGYRDLVSAVASQTGRRLRFLPAPFALWKAAAGIARHLPGTPLTASQVELMEIDNVVRPGVAGLRELGIVPRSIRSVLQMESG